MRILTSSVLGAYRLLGHMALVGLVASLLLGCDEKEELEDVFLDYPFVSLHTILESPDDDDASPHRRWAIECVEGEPIGAPISGVVTVAGPTSDGNGYALCVAQEGLGTICLDHVAVAFAQSGCEVVASEIIGTCGGLGDKEEAGIQLGVYAMDPDGEDMDLPSPDRWPLPVAQSAMSMCTRSSCSGAEAGSYCGSSSSLYEYDGSEADLVVCSPGVVAEIIACPLGCLENSAGLDDVCVVAPPSACDGFPDGYYCGEELVDYEGDTEDRVFCEGGVVSGPPEHCEGRCVVWDEDGGATCSIVATAATCEPCVVDADCLSGGLCLDIEGGDTLFCVQSCENADPACPSGYVCDDAPDNGSVAHCVPSIGFCTNVCEGALPGAYCGSNVADYPGDADDLIYCQADAVELVESCALGCLTMPAGQNDECDVPPPPDPCDGLASGDYCGSNLTGYSGDADDLVSCAADITDVVVACAEGCDVMASGENDQCAVPVEICGNGQVGVGEECDGVELGLQTCQGLGYLSGELACGDGCAFDTSGCVGGVCTSYRRGDEASCTFNVDNLVPDGTSWIGCFNITATTYTATTVTISGQWGCNCELGPQPAAYKFPDGIERRDWAGFATTVVGVTTVTAHWPQDASFQDVFDGGFNGCNFTDETPGGLPVLSVGGVQITNVTMPTRDQVLFTGEVVAPAGDPGVGTIWVGKYAGAMGEDAWECADCFVVN